MNKPIDQYKIICFNQDTKDRKRFFKAASFAHPAKMHLQLQIYLIEHYTRPGDIILDPMAGSGTILIATTIGRNVICVELEGKFVKMQQDNYEKLKSIGPMLGYQMGEARILQGDARNLKGLLADNIVFSPPYTNRMDGGDKILSEKGTGFRPYTNEKSNQWFTQRDQTNIGNLPYGSIEAAVFSPPYAEAQEGGGIAKKGYQGSKHSPTDLVGKRSYMPSQHGNTEGQIGNLPYKADAVITSPPYEGSISGKELPESEKLIERKSGKVKWGKHLRLGRSQLTKYADAVITSPPYEGSKEVHDIEFLKKTAGDASERVRTGKTKGHYFTKEARERALLKKQQGLIDNKANIGNLKSENYLQAMFQVYQECWKILKENGLMVLVVKNFIRDKKIVRLDLDTIKLCEQIGFVLKDRLKRKLTQQSFWRTIYHQKFPDVEKIEYEDVLVFQRAASWTDGSVE